MLSIALVSYINTWPFVDGLKRAFGDDPGIQLHLMPPSDCARALFDGQAQLALIPVGALPNRPELELLPSWCIGADGPVESVFLFSQQPVEDLEQVWLDRHSRSSNALAQILFTHLWKKEVRWLEPVRKHFDQIDEQTGGIVIGDEAIRIQHRFAYKYDLAEAWKTLTGLPFAFAVWAYVPGSLDTHLIARIETALADGVDQRRETARSRAADFGLTPAFAEHYLTECINYPFDEQKKQALDLFLSLTRTLSASIRQPR